MAETEQDRVWALMKKISFCMLSTWTGEKLRARPMDARVRREENKIYCLTDARHCKDDEIARYPNILLAFADTGAMKYVSLSGVATISNDRAKIRELWDTSTKAYWDSPDDPNIRLLMVTPDSAEYWDSPGKVVSMVKMAMAAATGAKPDIGDNRKVSMG